MALYKCVFFLFYRRRNCLRISHTPLLWTTGALAQWCLNAVVVSVRSYITSNLCSGEFMQECVILTRQVFSCWAVHRFILNAGVYLSSQFFMYCNTRANGQNVEEGMTLSLLRSGQIYAPEQKPPLFTV